MWKTSILRKILTWKALMPVVMLTWKRADCQKNAGDANLEGTDPQGNADLEGTIYPGHGAFSPTPEHFFQLPTYAGHQLSQGPLQGLGLRIHTRAAIHD